MWTRFDGEDDEVTWSRLGDDGLSAPRRLHDDNGVPDITPALVRVGDEVLVAWSRYDGNDYRLHAARWTGDRWQETATLPGRGAVFPSWQATEPGELFLVYRNGAKARWNVARMDERGRMAALTSVPGPSDSTPRVERSSPGEATVVFPSGRTAHLRLQPTPRLP